MAKEKQPTEKEITAEREKQRKAALATFQTGLVNYAAAYYVHDSKGYGDEGDEAVEKYIYQPTLKSKEGSELTANTLLSSRKKGKIYSGTTSEEAILEGAKSVVEDSLAKLKVEDIYRVMGSKAKIRKDLGNMYIVDLLHSENKEIKKYAQELIGSYVPDLMDKKVSQALDMRAKDRLSGLEEMVKPEDNIAKKLWNKVTGK